MDFTYTYKSSDGVRHTARISAPSRDEVFSELRKSGIRPIKVFEEGTKIASKPSYKWLAYCSILIMVLVVCGGVSYYIGRGSINQTSDVIKGTTKRHLPIGIASKPVEVTFEGVPANARPRKFNAIIASHLNAVELAQVFNHMSDRFLAYFSMPGYMAARIPELSEAEQLDFYDALDDVILIAPQEDKWKIDLKRIVVGMKDEVRSHLNAGWGIEDIMNWLKQRQLMEFRYRKQLLEEYVMPALTEKMQDQKAETNKKLRTMGLQEID